MTVIIAAKYCDGVMYQYDTLGVDFETGVKGSFNKVLQAENTPIVRGVSGSVPGLEKINPLSYEKFILKDISDLYARKIAPEKVMLRVTTKYRNMPFSLKNIISSFKKNYFKNSRYCFNSYIFSWPEENVFELYSVSSLLMEASSVNYAAIGSGAYSSVKKFLSDNYSKNMSEASIRDLLNQTFELSLAERKIQLLSGNTTSELLGKAVARHTKNGLEQLLFENDF
jgi:20S proteasome alpha/beta subunit